MNMITVAWDNTEKTAIRLDYFEPIASWDEYRNAVKESFELAKSHNHPVHFIHNPQDAKMPAGNPIAEIRRAINGTPPNTASVLMVVSNDFARRIMEVVIRISVKQAKNFFFVSSVDEARRVVAIQEEKKIA
jgi:hypothetical protein